MSVDEAAESSLPPATLAERQVSSKQLLALRIRAVAAAWQHQDEPLLRAELAQLGREASMLSKSVPLEGVAQRQQLAIEAGDDGWHSFGGRPRSYKL